MRIFTPIHFPSNIRRLFGWSVVGICLAVGLSVTRGAHQKHLAKHFFTKPCGLVRSRYVALTNGELKKAATETATATAAGTSLNKRFNEQNNSYARAWYISLPTVLWKTATWNDQILRCLRTWTTMDKFFFLFFNCSALSQIQFRVTEKQKTVTSEYREIRT